MKQICNKSAMKVDMSVSLRSKMYATYLKHLISYARKEGE